MINARYFCSFFFLKFDWEWIFTAGFSNLLSMAINLKAYATPIFFSAVFLVVLSHSGRKLVLSSSYGRIGKSWRLRTLVLLLSLVWSALLGSVLVRLQEEDLPSLVTMSDKHNVPPNASTRSFSIFFGWLGWYINSTVV